MKKLAIFLFAVLTLSCQSESEEIISRSTGPLVVGGESIVSVSYGLPVCQVRTQQQCLESNRETVQRCVGGCGDITICGPGEDQQDGECQEFPDEACLQRCRGVELPDCSLFPEIGEIAAVCTSCEEQTDDEGDPIKIKVCNIPSNTDQDSIVVHCDADLVNLECGPCVSQTDSTVVQTSSGFQMNLPSKLIGNKTCFCPSSQSPDQLDEMGFIQQCQIPVLGVSVFE